MRLSSKLPPAQPALALSLPCLCQALAPGQTRGAPVLKGALLLIGTPARGLTQVNRNFPPEYTITQHCSACTCLGSVADVADVHIDGRPEFAGNAAVLGGLLQRENSSRKARLHHDKGYLYHIMDMALNISSETRLVALKPPLAWPP